MAFEVGEIIRIPSPIDPHVHLREPGGEHKETIATGTFAALSGGYQAVFDMPNTPGRATINKERVVEKEKIALKTARTDMGIYAGFELDIDDRPTIQQAIIPMFRRVAGGKFYEGHTTGNLKEYGLEEVRPHADEWIKTGNLYGYKLPILLHAREEIGLETADYIARSGNPVHWCHVSTATEAEYCRTLTKKYPDLFTAGVTPHHLTMTSIDADFKYGWNGARMMPPLAKEADHDKLLDYFNKGYIQILETDHAPHAEDEKQNAESKNPEGHDEVGCVTCFGVSGIEFVLPVMMSLVQRRKITLDRLVDAMHHQPIRMLGLNAREMAKTETLIEVGPVVLGEQDRRGKSTNSPYVGWTGWGEVLGFEVDSRWVPIEDTAKENVKILIGGRQ